MLSAGCRDSTIIPDVPRCALIPLLLLLLPLMPAVSDEMPPPEDPWARSSPLPAAVYDALDTVLAAQLLTRHDLGFQKNPVPDPWRLRVVDQVLHDPLSGYDITWAYGQLLDSPDVAATLVSTAGWDFLTSQLDLAPLSPPPTLPDLDSMPQQLAAQFDRVRTAHAPLQAVMSQQDRQLLDQLLALASEDAASGPYDEESLIDGALALWEAIQQDQQGESWARFLQESLTLAAYTSAYATTLEQMSARPSPWQNSLVDALRQSGWEVVVGSEGDDVHEVRQGMVILDLAGDDTYHFALVRVGESALGHWILDLSGNDTYRGMSPGACGGALGSVSLVWDQSGDDVYRTSAVSQGAAILGVGMRVDVGGGRDLYDGGDFTQGAGLFGIGWSDDGGGDDNYSATLYGQGAALTGGLGLCLDHAGDDRYWAGGAHQDYPRWPEHWLSLSQGCAFGLRPTASGGIAFLGDFAGNDFYNVEVYGQGVGYWYALGMLLDKGGHDWYQCLQYGQGAGIHLAAGCLIDIAGIDHYNGWANLQGNGHDLGVGLFLEVAGRDYMTANDLSQGAGNANGLGLAIDLAGDDAWLVRNPDNNQGYGNPRRDFGSLGILLDLAGKDTYSIPGHGDGLLWTSSRWGMGYDTDAPEELAPVKFISVSGTSGATR